MSSSPSGSTGASSAPGTVQTRQPAIDLTEATSEPSLGELIAATTSDMSALLRSEVELAKVEIKEEVKTAGQAGAFMGAAGIVGYTAFTLLCFAAAWGLTEIMPQGFAFLVVALIVGAIAAVMFFMGKKKLENFSPVPEQTVETLQEDVQWAKQLKS